MTDVGAHERSTSRRTLQLAVLGIIAANCLTVASGVNRVSQIEPDSLLFAVAATSAYLPLHVRHMWLRMQRGDVAGGVWTLIAMAVVVAAMFPVIGYQWLGALYPLSTSALIVLRRPWSYVTFAALAVLPIPVTMTYGESGWALLFIAGVMIYGLGYAALTWLVVAVRELREARTLLAEQAVVKERRKLDIELQQELGTALARIESHGERAGQLLAARPDAAAAEVQALGQLSRRAMATARKLVRRYRGDSLRSELDTSLALLRAAGAEPFVVWSPTQFEQDVDGVLREKLRKEIARVLQEGALDQCTVRFSREDGRDSVEIR